MAITEINNEQGMKQFSVYVNIRSSSMPHIRLQKRIKGLDSKAEAMRKERALIKELSSKVAQKEGHGLTWRMIVQRWAETVSEEGYQYKSYNPATIKDHVSMMLTWTSDWLDRPASKVTRGEGRQVLDSILNEDRSKSFQKKVKNTINMIYNWAIEERFIRGVHNSPVHGLRCSINTHLTVL